MFSSKNNSQSGLTLIEITVAVSAFSLIIVAVIGAFLSSMGGTRRVNSQQSVMDEGRYAMEAMAKEIRMSEILNASGTNPIKPDCDSSANAARPCLLFKNSRGETMYFAVLDDKRLYKDLASVSFASTGAALTSNEAEVSDLDFTIQKISGMQPRVTISMKLSAQEKGGKVLSLGLQSTISSRQYQAEGVK